MAKLKRFFESNLTQIPTETAQNIDLSFEAKGLLLELLSHPIGLNIEKNYLIRDHCKENKLFKILKELKVKGYIFSEEVKNEKGIETQWIINPISTKKTPLSISSSISSSKLKSSKFKFNNINNNNINYSIYNTKKKEKEKYTKEKERKRKNIEKQNIEIILGAMNEWRNDYYWKRHKRKMKGFKNNPANSKNIVSRLNEGITVKELGIVAGMKFKEYKGFGDEYMKYFNPITIFSKYKFYKIYYNIEE